MTDNNLTEELTASQRFASNLAAAAGVILCGVFLLLCGTGVFDIAVSLAIAPAVLVALGLILLSNAFIQKNTVALYLGVILLVCALVSCLANFADGVSYSKLYPLYIASPAVASLITMLISRNYITHIKVIAFFGLPAALLFMQSFGVWAWQVVLPAIIMFVGLLALYLTLSARSKPEE